MLPAPLFELVGEWQVVGARVEANDSCQLIAKELPRLTKLAAAEAGWSTLYRDPTDSRLWELTYPQGELHGGGPPTLRVMQGDAAKEKYGLVV